MGNIDSGPVEETKSTRKKETRRTNRLYDYSLIDLFRNKEKNSKTCMFYIEYTYKQIGKDELWYQEQCRAL